MKEEQELLFPGDFIADEEMFLAGEGTYAEDGKVKAAGFGVPIKDMEKREVRLKSPVLIPMNYRRGDTAIGIVEKVRDNVAFVELISSEVGNYRLTPSDAPAVIRVTEVKSSFVKSLTNELKSGDIIRARIIEASPYNVSLSLKGDNLGVIKAFCSRCRHPLDKQGDGLICPQCNWKDRRKIASDYRQGRMKE